MGLIKNSFVKIGPIINDSNGRRLSIIRNTPAIFEISENIRANGNIPFIEKQSSQEVTKWCEASYDIASKSNVDIDLVRAIIYMETTHGYYDHLYDSLPFLNGIHKQKSIRPMNINFSYWKGLGITEESMSDPIKNIEIGVLLLSRIIKRVQNPTVAKVATLYNFIGAETVNDYGARVTQIYQQKPWKGFKGGSCIRNRVR